MNKIILCAILGCGACLGFIGWRVHAIKNQVTPQFEIVEDFSLSHAKGCDSLDGLAERALNTEEVAQHSTVTVLVLGDQKTADEPWQLARYSLPTDDRVLEGRAAKRRRQQDLLADLRNKCQAVRRTTVSPIFLGVKQAVADLRARRCSSTSRCELFVDSDLEENVEASVKKRLNGPSDMKSAPVPAIDNEGIKITFCGLAITTGLAADRGGTKRRRTSPGDASRSDRLRDVWSSLLTEPSSLEFEPYCPRPSDFQVFAPSRH